MVPSLRTTAGGDHAGRGAAGEPSRIVVAAMATAAVVVAPFVEPAPWPYVAGLVLPVVAFLCWAVRGVHPLLLTALVAGPTLVSQLSSALEPALFLMSMLALALAGWEEPTPLVVGCVAVAVATPVAAVALRPEAGTAWSMWILGTVLPAAMGWSFHRQERLAAQLERARADLAEATAAEERRRIARDVHDLVGHGLAAMLLQVTSARHVLRRDPDAAEEALASAEAVGRRSMQDLRRTVAALRDGDDALAPPPPDLAQVPVLIESARTTGVDVRLATTAGDVAAIEVGSLVGLAAYRIVQESVANATRHAPRATTTVAVGVDAAAGVLGVRVDTAGPLEPDDGEVGRARFGLCGMRERAEGVGGTFAAGPTPDGWRVEAALPLAVTGAGGSAP